MLVSTKRRVFQRRVLHATHRKNESKYRTRGAGGPDKIKQLFPRFIGSAVNHRDRPREPPRFRNAFFSGALARACNIRNSGATRANELRFAQAVTASIERDFKRGDGPIMRANKLYAKSLGYLAPRFTAFAYLIYANIFFLYHNI